MLVEQRESGADGDAKKGDFPKGLRGSRMTKMETNKGRERSSYFVVPVSGKERNAIVSID